MVEELTKSLVEVVNAVIATGKKGTVQLKRTSTPPQGRRHSDGD
ncbi:hypothetical protein [Microvirgula aerodenitrificans]|nr:hypothetical protein [Microvirgula aerodenitrificans]